MTGWERLLAELPKLATRAQVQQFLVLLRLSPGEESRFTRRQLGLIRRAMSHPQAELADELQCFGVFMRHFFEHPYADAARLKLLQQTRRRKLLDQIEQRLSYIASVCPEVSEQCQKVLESVRELV